MSGNPFVSPTDDDDPTPEPAKPAGATRVLFAVLTALVGVTVFWAIRRGDSEAEKHVGAALSIAKIAGEIHQDTMTGVANGTRTHEELAEILQRQTLRFWNRAISKIKAARTTDESPDLERLEASLTLRRDATVNIIEAVRTGDEVKLKTAEEMWAEAGRIVPCLRTPGKGYRTSEKSKSPPLCSGLGK